MTRFPLCRRGHKLKTGKDGRQRCPICQSAYLRDWRKRKMEEKLIIRDIKSQLATLRKGLIVKGLTVPESAIMRIKIFDCSGENGLQTCGEYRIPFSFLDGYNPGDANT